MRNLLVCSILANESQFSTSLTVWGTFVNILSVHLAFLTVFSFCFPSYADEVQAEKPAPFAFADFSWAPGNYAPAESPMATKYFTPEFGSILNTISTSTIRRTIRSPGLVKCSVTQVQLTQMDLAAISLSKHWLACNDQFGMYSSTPRAMMRAPDAVNGNSITPIGIFPKLTPPITSTS